MFRGLSRRLSRRGLAILHRGAIAICSTILRVFLWYVAWQQYRHPSGLTRAGLILLAAGSALLADAREPAGAGERPVFASLEREPRLSSRIVINIETLTLESDFTMYMRHDCPEELRRKTLRRLWTLLPRRAIVLDSAV